jgi:hypothetical protein
LPTLRPRRLRPEGRSVIEATVKSGAKSLGSVRGPGIKEIGEVKQ